MNSIALGWLSRQRSKSFEQLLNDQYDAADDLGVCNAGFCPPLLRLRAIGLRRLSGRKRRFLSRCLINGTPEDRIARFKL